MCAKLSAQESRASSDTAPTEEDLRKLMKIITKLYTNAGLANV